MPSVPAVVEVGECQSTGCGYSFIFGYPPATIERLVLLNAIVPPTGRGAIIVSEPVSVDEVKELVAIARHVDSFIGHEATAKLLSELLTINVPVNRGMYVPRNGDYAVVVRLKKRLEKPEDIRTVTPSDVEFRVAYYMLL
jgi:hypothetical protein